MTRRHAELQDYPNFKTAFNLPIKLNFMLVYDSYAATRVDDDDGGWPSRRAWTNG